MQSENEHRRQKRFELALPIQVLAASGAISAVQTSSLDFSARGFYFTVAKDFDLGSEFEFDVALPRDISEGKDVRICGKAKILRIDQTDKEGTVGVAAYIKQFEFKGVHGPRAVRQGRATGAL